MLKKPFMGLSVPQFNYSALLEDRFPPQQIPAARETVLLVPQMPKPAGQPGAVVLGVGDELKTGQKIVRSGGDAAYAISPATGQVASIAPHVGDFGRTFTAVTIQASEEEVLDDPFSSIFDAPTLEPACEFLMGTPGNPPLAALVDPDKSIHTLIVTGADADLMIRTNRSVLTHRVENVLEGIRVLKTLTGVDTVILAVPENFLQGYGHVEAEIKTVPLRYPSAFPQMMMQNLLGLTVPAGQSCEDLGVSIFTAEAAAAIGVAFSERRFPRQKLLTITRKDGSQTIVETCIGTPLSHVLSSLGIEVQARDRIIFGGPMTGAAIYSETTPVLPGTDSIMIQDSADIALTSDDPCINCGECVRICPARIPVNMLVRFLEAGQYEEAADLYDLHCCIECGLCSYVCVSRMPIFQYIRLGKYELGRMNDVEATHE